MRRGPTKNLVIAKMGNLVILSGAGVTGTGKTAAVEFARFAELRANGWRLRAAFSETVPR